MNGIIQRRKKIIALEKERQKLKRELIDTQIKINNLKNIIKELKSELKDSKFIHLITI